MKVLNSRERNPCIYECEASQMANRMVKAIERRKVDGVPTAFSLAIDARL